MSSPKDHCSIITFTEGAVRGNHYHKESTQYTYVIDGELILAEEDGQTVIGPGELVTHPPYKAHAFKAIKPSTILVFADGVRGGDDYEKDVYRVKLIG